MVRFSSFEPFRRAMVALACASAWLVGAFSGDAVASPESGWNHNDHASIRLVAATTATGAAESLRLGLQFQLAPGWKIYWRSPGDAGFPPRIDWSGSTNVAAADIRWPAPERFQLFGLDTFGYGGEVVLPIELKPGNKGEPVGVVAKVEYLVCETICVPHDAQLSLSLPAGAAAPSAHAHLIDRFVARVPGDGAGAGISIERAAFHSGTPPEVSVTARGVMPFAQPDLFIEGPAGWTFGKPAVSLAEGGRHVVLRATARRDAAQGDTLVGSDLTITLVDGERAAERKMSVAAGAAARGELALAGVLALALLGGLILNLMPCVLPVLSLKLLNVVSHGGAARNVVRGNFLASAAGIVASFLALAAALVGLKASGHAIGWGIQFQNSAFLIFMALVLVLFAANLWGWFEIRLPYRLSAAVANVPGGAREDRWGAFLTGALATLLATPCSAPFLGTAVGFALASGPAEIFAVFTALGVGLALPYLLVAAMPALAQRMPRPGRWMIVLRRVLGLALLGTAVWLLSVIEAQIGWRGMAALAALLLVLVGFLWVVREAGERRRILRLGVVVVLALIAFALPARFSPTVETASIVPGWQAWDRAEVDRLVAAGQVVLVDVTADWCITCQVNKSLVLTRGEVAERLAGTGGGRVVAMRADWTRPDPRIAEYLASFGRYGIPFNVVYGPAAPSGIPLPELLTSDQVLAAFERAAGRAQAAAPAR
ncbi:MAG TPA: protein-disulfide reductase DsbD domain-containing protein [Alphaproteobacteria bacterium]|nr:protein-disulfide reductase DsbD domain-containing protein [Alphaproteobacteria bacterium]